MVKCLNKEGKEDPLSHLHRRLHPWERVVFVSIYSYKQWNVSGVIDELKHYPLLSNVK